MIVTTPLDNIELTLAQVVQATGVPQDMVRRMCTEDRVPARNVGKGELHYWRIRTGDLQVVRDVYGEMQQEAQEGRRQSQSATMKGRAERLSIVEQRVTNIEAALRDLGCDIPTIEKTEITA